eukprot:13170464-Ditylum_brightwellii.AAC.1
MAHIQIVSNVPDIRDYFVTSNTSRYKTSIPTRSPKGIGVLYGLLGPFNRTWVVVICSNTFPWKRSFIHFHNLYYPVKLPAG